MKNLLLRFCLFLLPLTSFAQADSLPVFHPDSSLRIIDLNPYFSLHVDSTLNYQLQINKNPSNYFWFLKNAPVGLRINKESGLVSFKADKAYFLSGKLKYDVNYRVLLGVQNLNDPKERIDTSFSIVFFNTEIIASRVKPTVSGTIAVEEGETIAFRVFCENGSYPVENIITQTSMPISQYKLVQNCGDEFSWIPPYNFTRDTDPGKEKAITITFIGTTRTQLKDTATVRLVVRDALNYPVATEEYRQAEKNVQDYITQLMYTFLLLDKRLKKTKGARTTFDLTSASTSLTGTILSTSSSQSNQRTGKVLPSVGLALVPIKEAAVPNKAVDQNQAALIRTSIKRLDYMARENRLVGTKDPDIIRKTTKLRDELKQVQVQLIEVPVEFNPDVTKEELDHYFNSKRVRKKYSLSTR